jgi:hypothetical protein
LIERPFKVESNKKHNYLENVKLNNEQNTFELYLKLIYKLDKFEKEIGKTAESMNKKEFLEFFKSLNSTSYNVLCTNKSTISGYLFFIKDENKLTIGLNELKKITTNELSECVVILIEKLKYITEKEYYEIIQDNRGNYQDKAVIVLLWNKVKGKHKCSEILNLKISDIDVKNRQIMVGDKNIKLKEIEMDIINKAINEQIYKKTTMERSGKVKKTEVTCLIGDYVIKTTEWRKTRKSTKLNSNQCLYSTFANRMSTYFSLVLGRSELEIGNIYKSRIYYRLVEKYGIKITRKEFKEFLQTEGVKAAETGNKRIIKIMYDKIEKEKENKTKHNNEELEIEKFYDLLDGNYEYFEHSTLTFEGEPNTFISKGDEVRKFTHKKYDFLKKHKTQNILGLYGELMVLNSEKNLLKKNKRVDLSEKVEHVSLYGDGLGYDILSYDIYGNVKYIEVKTTSYENDTTFFISENELEFSRQNDSNYYLYRVYELNINKNNGKYFFIKGNLYDKLILKPRDFAVKGLLSNEV